jgi:hypothetical protein
MRVDVKNAIPLAANETAYNQARRARFLILQTEDINRADQRRVSYALIDSTLAKWRYPANKLKI